MLLLACMADSIHYCFIGNYICLCGPDIDNSLEATLFSFVEGSILKKPIKKKKTYLPTSISLRIDESHTFPSFSII